MSRILLLVLIGLSLSGCVRLPPTETPRRLPPESRNDTSVTPPSYVVFGQRYFPIASAEGYRERGVASWYGGKFHGRRTSNGEVYDMHGLTAAHKTLPLPTWVRVTNLRNGSSVVVRVNDRGPFVKNRLIDLSYEAARQLDMLAAGTTLVEVEALQPEIEVTPVQASTSVPLPDSTLPEPIVALPASLPSSSQPTGSEIPPLPATEQQSELQADDPTIQTYVQVGAFADLSNAQRMELTLYNAAIDNVRVDAGEGADGAPLFRVQIGPVADVATYDTLIAQLETLGIRDIHLIVFAP